MKAPPPRPELCGFTSPRTACIATAASAADPPACSTRMPACAASGLAATTIAWGAGPAAAGTLPGADADTGCLLRQAYSASSSDSAAVVMDRTRTDFIIVGAKPPRSGGRMSEGDKNHNTV